MNILKSNNKYFFYNKVEILKRLEPKNYVLDFNITDIWIEESNGFEFEEKLYDIDTDLIDMVSEDFKTNERNIGVLLSGVKGQGKSFTAKRLVNNIDLPVIIINKKIPLNVKFIEFLSQIEQDYVLFIDEFEKLFTSGSYNEDDDYDISTNEDYHTQISFLSFMDGAVSLRNKILFVLTTNNRINEHFMNRPSRIKYLKKYEHLDDAIIETIINDKLIDKNYRNDLLENISTLNINIDLLFTIIDTINKFNKPFSEFSNIFNYSIEEYRYDFYRIDENGNEVYTDFFRVNKKIDPNSKRINGYVVKKVLEYTPEKIIFEAPITRNSFSSSNDDDDDVKGKKIYVVKLLDDKVYDNKFSLLV